MINFEKLEVYQDAVLLAIKVYKLTTDFPKDELFGIISQLRRASISMSANIAEGSSRSKRDFAHFLDMARGSCFELVPLLTVSLQLGYITSSDYDGFYQTIETLTKRINALKKSINN